MKILHAFLKNVSEIEENLDRISWKGYTHIQLTPLSQTKQTATATDWWVVYQPTNHFEFNQFTTEEELRSLCSKAHAKGIKIICDMVLRHVAGADDSNKRASHKVDEFLIKCIAENQKTGNEHNYISRVSDNFGMPTIEYGTFGYGDYVNTLMNWYESLGVDAFRIDMGKHFDVHGNYTLKYAFQQHECYGECIMLQEYEHKAYLEMFKKLIVYPNERFLDHDNYITFAESHDDVLTWHNKNDNRYNDFSKLDSNKMWFMRPEDKFNSI